MLIHQTENSIGAHNYHTARYTNKDFDPHFHLIYEIIYVLEGNIELTVNGHKELLVPGDFAMILSNEAHQIRSIGQTKQWICGFSGDFVPDFDKAVKNKTGSSCKFHCDQTTFDFLKEHVLFSEYLEKRKQDPYQFTAGLYLLCGQYLRSTQLVDRNTTQNTMMNDIVEYINQNYRQDITLKHIAQLLGYDYYYCSRLFGSIFGMRFSDYLNNIRCSAAVELIRTTDKSICVIAGESGFQSVRAFNEIFSRLMGMTPLQYRKQMGV